MSVIDYDPVIDSDAVQAVKTLLRETHPVAPQEAKRLFNELLCERANMLATFFKLIEVSGDVMKVNFHEFEKYHDAMYSLGQARTDSMNLFPDAFADDIISELERIAKEEYNGVEL